jgi:hypothetical protein
MSWMNTFVVFYLVSTWLFNLINIIKQRPNDLWVFLNSYMFVGLSIFVLDYYIGVIK